MKKFGIFLLVVIVVAYGANEYRKSELLGNHFKYVFVKADSSGKVQYVAIDPQVKQIYVLNYPPELEIKSRSVGVYQIAKLYAFGVYEGDPGEFVRKKVQGFMRAPISGYIVSDLGLKNSLRRAIFSEKENTFSRLDALILYLRSLSYTLTEEGEEQLVRAGVIKRVEDKYEYFPERLQQYLSTRIFDWGIGRTGLTAAVINRSGEDGLGKDISQFLINAGVDVVLVGAEEKKEEETWIAVAPRDKEAKETAEVLKGWFFWKKVAEEDTTGKRARMVIYVGRDALKLF